jgi:hypothetical protein
LSEALLFMAMGGKHNETIEGRFLEERREES